MAGTMGRLIAAIARRVRRSSAPVPPRVSVLRRPRPRPFRATKDDYADKAIWPALSENKAPHG